MPGDDGGHASRPDMVDDSADQAAVTAFRDSFGETRQRVELFPTCELRCYRQHDGWLGHLADRCGSLLNGLTARFRVELLDEARTNLRSAGPTESLQCGDPDVLVLIIEAAHEGSDCRASRGQPMPR